MAASNLLNRGFDSPFLRDKPSFRIPTRIDTEFDWNAEDDEDFGIAGAGSYKEAQRKAEIALDHYGYGLTKDEVDRIQNPRGRGLLETVFRVLSVPANATSYVVGMMGPWSNVSADMGWHKENLRNIVMMRDDELLRDMPWLDSDGDGQADISSAAFLKGAGSGEFRGGAAKAATAVGGFGLDVVLDPLSWVSFGTLGVGTTAAVSAGRSVATKTFRETAEALIKGAADDLADPYARRVAREMTERSKSLRDEVFKRASDDIAIREGRDLTAEELRELRKLVDDEFFKHEVNQSLLLDGLPAKYELADPSVFGDDAAKLVRDSLTESSSVMRDHMNRLGELIEQKQFRTLAKEFPEFVASKEVPAYATGGVTITTPFFRKQAGGIKLGLRTDRTVSKPIRAVVQRVVDMVPETSRFKQAVRSVWSRRGVEVATRKMAGKGRLWDLAATQGVARRALQSLDVVDAPEEMLQVLRRVSAAAADEGVDEQEAFRILGSVLDGELTVDELLNAPHILKPKTAEAVAEAHGMARAVLDTIHSALSAFDDDLGRIENYFPLVSSKEMNQVLESMATSAVRVPLDEIESVAGAMADQAAGARLRVGGQILAEWLRSAEGLRKIGGGVVVDRSRYMNSRSLGKTIFSAFGDVDVSLSDKRKLAEILGVDPAQVGWSSRVVMNDAVMDALRYMEQKGLVKLPKGEFHPFSMDVPMVLESYVKATQRVLHFKAFVHAAEELGMVKAVPEAIEVGLSLSRTVNAYQDSHLDQLVRTWRRFLDQKERAGAVAGELETVTVGSRSLQFPKGMMEDPKVAEAVSRAHSAIQLATKQHSAAREGAEKALRELVEKGGLPEEFAEDFAVLEADKAMRDLFRTLWSSHSERVANLRSQAIELAGRRSPEQAKEAMREIDRVAREWEQGIRDSIEQMTEQWANVAGFTRYKSEGSFDLAEVFTDPLTGQVKSRGEAISDQLVRAVIEEVKERIGSRLSPTQLSKLDQVQTAADLRGALDLLDLSDNEIATMGVLKAWQDLRALVRTSNLTVNDLVEHMGAGPAMEILTDLAGFVPPPTYSDELYDLAALIAERKNGFPYSPKRVSRVEPADILDLADEYSQMDAMVTNPAVLEDFRMLKDETLDQLHRLEEQGFEFYAWRDPNTDPYPTLDDFREAVERKQVYIKVGATAAPPELTEMVELGSGVPVPFIDAFDTIHRIFGHVIHGYDESAEGITNAWLAHMQLYGRDVLPAFASLTRVRRIAELSAGMKLPVKMDLPADARIVSPFYTPTDQRLRHWTDPSDVKRAGSGYGGKEPLDQELADIQYEEEKASGFLSKRKAHERRRPQDYTESRENRERLEAEMKYDSERKFRLLLDDYHGTGNRINALRQAAFNVNRQAQRLAELERKLPVRQAVAQTLYRTGPDGVEELARPGSVLVTLRDGTQKLFASEAEMQAWWESVRLTWSDTLMDADGVPQASRWTTEPTPIEVVDNPQGKTPPKPGEVLRGDEDPWNLGISADEVGGVRESAETLEEEMAKDLKWAQTAPETVEARVDEGADLPDWTARGPSPSQERMDAEVEAARQQPHQIGIPFGQRTHVSPAVRKEDTEYPRHLMEGWLRRPFVQRGVVAETATGGYAVFPGLAEMEAEIVRVKARMERVTKDLADAYEKLARKVDEFEWPDGSKGIDLAELLEKTPMGLRESLFDHPIFHSEKWLQFMEAAHKKMGAEDARLAAAHMRSSWRDATASLLLKPDLDALVSLVDGRGSVPGAGLLDALAAGDWQFVAENQGALRALMDRAGLDSRRLLIEPLGGGNWSVRWGTQPERILPPIDSVRPTLMRALSDVGLHPDETWSTRRLIAEAKARGIRPPELGDLLDRATVKGNLPVDVEDYFYLHELLPKLSIWKKAGAGELKLEAAQHEAGRALKAVLDELEPFVASKGLKGDTARIQEVWEANRRILARELTAKDFQTVAMLVDSAPASAALGPRLMQLRQNHLDRMYSSAYEAFEALEQAVNDLYQELPSRVRQFYHDAIDAVDYFAMRQADMESFGRNRLNVQQFKGFDPHYSQVLRGEDAADFERRLLERNEAAKRVASDLKALMRDRALDKERASFVDFAMKGLADILPDGTDEESFKHWLSDRVKQLSDPVRPQSVELGTMQGFIDQSQFGVRAQELDGKLIDEHMGIILESMAVHTAAMWTPIGVRLMSDMVRKFESYWKGATTVARPTFVPRNIVGGVFNGMIVDTGVREYAWVANKALKVRRALAEGKTWEEALKVLDPKDAEIFDMARRYGVFETQFVADLGLHSPTRRRSLNPLSPNFVLFDIGGKFMESSEDFLRMAVFKRWYQHGNASSGLFASEMVKAVHFDYANLTQLETKIKRWVPFFVWTRRNIPLQFKVLLERPGLINRYVHMMENVGGAFSDPDDPSYGLPIPSWMGSQAVALTLWEHDDEAWTRFIFSPDVPIRDLEQFVASFTGGDPNGPVIGALEWAAGTLNPWIRVPIDIFQRAEYGDVPAPMGLSQAFQVLENFGFDLGTENVDSGQYEVPNWMRSLYEAIVPFQREMLESVGVFQGDDRRAQRLGAASSDASLDERARSAVLSFVRSLGVRGATPADLKQDEINLKEVVSNVLDHATKEGRILRDADGDRLRRIDLARIMGDPLAGRPTQAVNMKVRAIDGDTLILEDGERIRLAYLNTPELGSEQAEEARRYLQRALRMGRLEVRRTGYDPYGRTVAEVFVDGVNLSDALLGAGFGGYWRD